MNSFKICEIANPRLFLDWEKICEFSSKIGKNETIDIFETNSRFLGSTYGKPKGKAILWYFKRLLVDGYIMLLVSEYFDSVN